MSRFGIGAIRDLVTASMAIDMGSASTIIAVRGKDVVLDEPSLVAVNELTNEVIAYGHDAEEMRGREGRDVSVVAPLIGGVVADFERTKKMLAFFVGEACKGFSAVNRQAVMSVISEVTHVEQRALLNAAENANIGKVFMMEEGLAAAFGAGIRANDKRASAVVDIGFSTTNIAIVAKGTLVHSSSERIGSSDINSSFINHIRRHRALIIGDETAEKLKTEFISVVLPQDLAKEITVRGRDVQTGAPNATEVTAGELYPVAETIVRRITNQVNDALTELPAEVAADIYDRGLILTGGGAHLNGLDQYLREKTRLPVMIPDAPRYATVRGLLGMYEDPELLERVTRNEPHLLQDAESYEA